ncbi:MAG: PIN domain-containing protein [Actinomycetota bacterium]
MSIFVDSNVLVYARDSSESVKQPKASEWMNLLWRSRSGRVSFQVLTEFYVTATRKLSPGLSADFARRDVRALLAWHPVPMDAQVLQAAWDVEKRFRLSFWDALIVGAAQVAECEYLLTEDLQDGQKLGDVRVVNPFAQSPESILGGV